MKENNIFLDLLAFEIKYPYGHLYWDRCGQTILDIEMLRDGWFGAVAEGNTARLENPEKNMVLIFNDQHFIITAKRLKELSGKIIKEDLQRIWKIARANLGIEEYDRLGCRFHFIKPTKSVEESEVLIRKSEFNVVIPKQLSEPNYNLSIRQVVSIFEKEEMDYRVELKGITRSEGINPSGLLSARPKAMSKKQKEYRFQKMKRLAEYSVNPMYGVMLDIDCATYSPEQISVGEFVDRQATVIKHDFLPILEKL